MYPITESLNHSHKKLIKDLKVTTKSVCLPGVTDWRTKIWNISRRHNPALPDNISEHGVGNYSHYFRQSFDRWESENQGAYREDDTFKHSFACRQMFIFFYNSSDFFLIKLINFLLIYLWKMTIH